MHKPLNWVQWVSLATTLALALSMTYVVWQLDQARSSSRVETCQAFLRLDDSFTKLIRASERSLPTLTYYRQHPQELRKVLAEDEQSIAVLRASIPSYC